MKSVSAAARPLRHHLRFQILPGPRVEADARDLAAFCRRHGIEEVVLFFAAEEWNNGLLSRAEENRWFKTIRTAKTLLEQAGLVVSLNPWMTSLHCSRGRTFPRDRAFIPTVSPTGQVSTACASFADPAFQDYLSRLYGRFATLGFRVIWVEDDFRFHNHGPLDWGGGFEQPALARFALKIGKPATREEVVAALLKPGAPHPWRAVWLSVWREIILEVAAQLSAAVAAASDGRTRLGLMSSAPAAHSFEGRDWTALFDALSINGEVAHRPHFGPYSETPGTIKTYSSQMLDLQKTYRPATCEVAPEIENFPFTRWNKSDTQTWAEMALCQIHGSDALLLDLFPFSGNPASAEPEIGEMLDAARPGLAWLAAHFPKGLETQGVGVPYKPDAAIRHRLADGATLGHYGAANPFEAGQFCMQYGMPITSRQQAVNALFGPLAWAFADDEIEEFLRGGLLLDATAAAVLLERGFGRQLGLAKLEWVDREADAYAIEEAIDPACGVAPGFFMNANMGGAMARLSPVRGASAWTRILRPDRTVFGPGWIVHRNPLGGRIAVCASPNPNRLAASNQRQTIAQALVRFVSSGKFASPMAAQAPHQLVIHFGKGARQRVAVLNCSTDPTAPRLVWSGRRPALQWTRLAPLARPELSSRNAPLPYLGLLAGTPRD